MRGNPPPKRLRRWLTAIKRRRKDNRRRVAEYQLTPREIHTLLAAQRQVPMATMARAMGMRLPAPHFNPPIVITNPGGRAMARRRKKRRGRKVARKRPSGQMSLPVGGSGGGSRPRKVKRAKQRRVGMARRFRAAGHTSRRAYLGPVQGPSMADGFFHPESRVKMGRRARGRGRARVYGPVMAPSAYKARRKKRRGSSKRRTPAQRAATRRMIAANRRRGGGGGHKRRAKARRSTGGKPRRTAAQRAATRKMLAANRARRGRGRARRSSGRRMPSRKALRRYIRSLPKKAELRIFSGVRRGKKLRGYTLRNPRGGSKMARHNPRRRRRRNPGLDIMGTAKRLVAAAVPAVAGGAIMSLIDNKVLAKQSPIVRVLAKVAAAGAASVALRSRPNTAALLMGAILGSVGADLGPKLGGWSTMGQIAYLVREDQQAMNALIDSQGQAQTVPSLNGFDSLSTADVNLG